MALVHVWVPGLEGFGGGVTAFCRELVLALGQDHKVRVVAKHDKCDSWRGVFILPSGSAPKPLRTLHFALNAVILAQRTKPQVVILGHPNFAGLTRVVRRLGTPVSVVAHGIELGQLSRARRNGLRAADRIWAVSRWTRGLCMSAGVNETRIALAPETFDEGRFRIGEVGHDLRGRWGLMPPDKVILTVSRLEATESYKGYDRVLRALPAVQRAVGPVKYLIVGKGNDAPRVRALARSVGVDEAVRLCGFVPEDDLPDYYRLADAFVMPSTGEGFGIAFLEALACGTPVLGGRDDGTPDALLNGELGLLVDPLSVDEIGQGITALLLRQGPRLWFDPPALRARCVEAHGRASFKRRVDGLLQPLLARSIASR